ncbi:DUF1648 domain-containing protein [Weissella ceti]|uniref:DUF1648 domain-containing protein n=1 Tax=Weissella ceti TaxID=759620 RepID=UPI001BCA9601|nr:DUF1648 domain-containing protein [Weissella ceti]QVK12225.1 DUF1648 domain-containing protein [Weissella ceti]
MKIGNKTSIVLSVIVVLLPILVGIYFLPNLPEQVAVHWGLNGQADRWASRESLVFGIPLFMTVIQLIILIIVSSRFVKHPLPKMAYVVRWLIPVLSWVVTLTSLYVGLGQPLDMGMVGTGIAGLILIIMGYFIPSTPMNQKKKRLFRNFTNEQSYNHVMRVISNTMMTVGALIFASMFFAPIVSAVTILGGIALIIFVTFSTTFRALD